MLDAPRLHPLRFSDVRVVRELADDTFPKAARRSGRWARLASAVAATMVLISVPAVAQAEFSSATSNGVSASTLSLLTPQNTSITPTCQGRNLTLTIASYGTVPGANAFRIEVFRTPTDPSPVTVDRVAGDLSAYTMTFGNGTKSPRTFTVRGLYQTVGGLTWVGSPTASFSTCSF